MPTPLYLEDGIELSAITALPGSTSFLGALVATQSGGALASPAQLAARLTPPDIYTDTAPSGNSPAGVENQGLWYKRTSTLTDRYVYQSGAWVKQFTFNAEGNQLVILFDSQGAAPAITFGTGAGQAPVGTYTLPVSGADVSGLTNVQYQRNGVVLTGATALFGTNDLLSFTATTTTGGQLVLREQ